MFTLKKIVSFSFLLLSVLILTGCGSSREDLFYKGLNYYEGNGVPVNKAKAVECWKQAAEDGLAEAQFNLGVCYDKGEGVEKDLNEAANWFREAALNGLPTAQTELGRRYVLGMGVTKDYKQAKEWLRKAALLGDQEAQEMLQKIDDLERLEWLRGSLRCFI